MEIRDIARGKAGSLWFFKESFNEHYNSEVSVVWGLQGSPNGSLDEVLGADNVFFSSLVMYLGCYLDSDGEYRTRSDGFFDIDDSPPKYYKVMAVTTEGEVKIGWMRDGDGRKLRSVESYPEFFIS